MCGIAGLWRRPPGRGVIEADVAPLRDALRHRGPDGHGVVVDERCGLAHTRLAVIDLSPRGLQPMTSPSGRFVLTYNGEVYNYRELREALARAGRRFSSDSDTEIILHIAEVHGIDGFAQLEGMFAFGLWDRERRQLVLVRDRLGIKPLFWTDIPDGLAFASEPKALRPLAAPWSLGADRVAEYLAFRHLAGEEAMEPPLRTLLPGHRLIASDDGVRIEQWWKPDRRRTSDPSDTLAVMAAAVRRQLVSDVPVGVFLSGGVDSAIVAGAASDALPAIDAFTVGFKEQGWDETDRAAYVATALRAEARVLHLDEAQYVEGLGSAIWHLDAPLNHAHSVHLMALSRLARKHITVALTGEGSDELFAGYPRYRLHLLARALARVTPSGVGTLAHRLRARRPRWARLFEAAAADGATAIAGNAAFVPADEAAQLAGLADTGSALQRRLAIAREAQRAALGELDALLELERRTYLVCLLQRMDRMSMAVGLECRVPLLDERVVEHALGLSVRDRIDLFDTKKPVRRAAAERFGRAYAHAPKSGFGVPLDAWLRGAGPFAKLAEKVLGEARTRERGWFDAGLASRYLAEHRRGERDRSEALWGLLNLELWGRICVDGDGPQGAQA